MMVSGGWVSWGHGQVGIAKMDYLTIELSYLQEQCQTTLYTVRLSDCHIHLETVGTVRTRNCQITQEIFVTRCLIQSTHYRAL